MPPKIHLSRLSDHDPQPATTDIVSLPSSVQHRLDEARALLDQPRHGGSASVLQQAGAELARANPEIFALLVAGQMGARGIAFEEGSTETRIEQVEKYIFGVRYGREVRTVTVGRDSLRKAGFF